MSGPTRAFFLFFSYAVQINHERKQVISFVLTCLAASTYHAAVKTTRTTTTKQQKRLTCTGLHASLCGRFRRNKRSLGPQFARS